MSIGSLISSWRSDPSIMNNICAWNVQPAKQAKSCDFPDFLHPKLVQILRFQNINYLYQHQYESLVALNIGKNVVISTETASGKSLCYNLPIINAILKNKDTRALYLFPTKALTQDQLSALNLIIGKISIDNGIKANIYDGDTPTGKRKLIRETSNIILTNPDMLHSGILPHHTIWCDFFTNLQFIVIDEIHIYRGIFGSHVANVIRRLQRISSFYKVNPQYILTSATINNPLVHAQNLIEKPVTLINNDGAPQGEKHFIIYNPPIIDKKLGIRQSSYIEGTRLTSQLTSKGIQTIVFGRTRQTIELLLVLIRKSNPHLSNNQIRGYRGGYLAKQRREIEEGLRDKKVRIVTSTSALELGIDIGDLEAAILIGYPGSITSTRQQAGRAGRKNNTSLAVLLTSANALDQYLAAHPDYFFNRSPEEALIEPNNLIILLQHIRCAVFELPFKPDDKYGKTDEALISEFLNVLGEWGEVIKREDKTYWISDQYPASDISLRSVSPDNIVLLNGNQVIGKVDRASAPWMIHPNAIYLHEGNSYIINELNLGKNFAKLSDFFGDYYTQPVQDVIIKNAQKKNTENSKGCVKHFGELIIQSKVTGYRKILLSTRENIGNGNVDLPPTILSTYGYWFSIEPELIKKLKAQMLWDAEENDYGKDWQRIRQEVLERDKNICRICGKSGNFSPLHVHHIQPFRSFNSLELANSLHNLITLCPSCHRKAEQVIRIRSGLSGLAYIIINLAPFILMCTNEDIGIHSETNFEFGENQPTIVIYDNIQGGMGLANKLFYHHRNLLEYALETISTCPCENGCPSCVGPVGEAGYGGKKEALALCSGLV